MKRRHHLEWHRFRNNGSPDWRGRRDRGEDVGIRIAGAIRSAGATLIDLLNGSLMGNPSFVELSNMSSHPTGVVVDLSKGTSHDLFETGQFILEVLQSVVENVYLGVLLSYHLAKVATLTKS